MTCSSPPSAFLTSGASSVVTTTPTSQNQLTTKPPHHSRYSRLRSRSKAQVDRAMLKSITRSGAASPVRGMRRAEIQEANANAIIRPAKAAGLPFLDAKPAMIVPVRMAMKVAPSTSALPRGNSASARWSGRMPYLIGPNRAAMTPTKNRAANRSAWESYRKPAIAMAATAISMTLSLLATTDLSKRSANSPPIADRTKNGKMRAAGASAIRASEYGPAHLNRSSKTSAVLRKLSLKALKNWHQNRGANRRVANRLGVIGGPSADSGPTHVGMRAYAFRRSVASLFARRSVPIGAPSRRKVEMRAIELHADTWDTAMDFVTARKVARGRARLARRRRAVRIAKRERSAIVAPRRASPIPGAPTDGKCGRRADGVDTGGRGGRGQRARRDGRRCRGRGDCALLGRRRHLCDPQCVHPRLCTPVGRLPGWRLHRMPNSPGGVQREDRGSGSAPGLYGGEDLSVPARRRRRARRYLSDPIPVDQI